MLVMNADSDGLTPLIWAVDRGNVSAMEVLVAKGAEIDTKVCLPSFMICFYSWRTVTRAEAWIFAIFQWEKNHCVFLFPNSVIFCHLQDVEGQTALHHAILSNQEEVAKYLFEHGANINIADKDGNTPLSQCPAHWQWLQRTTG